ncbi:MAG: tetratricopeptide repeat protein, partial [Bryocella sp.]
MIRPLLFLLLLTAPLAAQNLPAGTHSVDAPSHQDALNVRIDAAETNIEQHHFDAAVTKLKAAIADGAHDARVYYDLGFAAERTGDDATAIHAYKQALIANPAVGQPRVALGLLEARNGHMDEARTNLRAAAALQQEAPVLRGRALRALARMDAISDPATARAELIQAIKLTEESPEDTLLAADLAAQAGDDADAEAAYRRALITTHGSVDATAGLAHLLIRQKKNVEAETLITIALKSNPDDPRLLAQLAVLYAAEDKAGKAIPLIEQLRASRPAFAADLQMAGLLAHLYSLNGDYAKAETLDKTLLVKTPNDPALLDDLGTALVHQQKYAEAEAVLSKAVSLRDSFSSVQDWATSAEHLA